MHEALLLMLEWAILLTLELLGDIVATHADIRTDSQCLHALVMLAMDSLARN